MRLSSRCGYTQGDNIIPKRQKHLLTFTNDEARDVMRVDFRRLSDDPSPLSSFASTPTTPASSLPAPTPVITLSLSTIATEVVEPKEQMR